MAAASNDFRQTRSLEEVHRSVPIPPKRGWRRLWAFAGPAYLISVGYMDPGNWATDIQGGSQFGYRLLFVLVMSNLMAVLLQTLSARLGLVTGRDLAQACRDDYPRPVTWVLFILCEIAIAACDLAEVLGSAIGLNLLFGIPMLWGVILTGSDVFFLLLIQKAGVRKLEAFILMLVGMIGLCFLFELFLCKPSIAGIAGGFVPKWLKGEELYVAIGIIGATVMPHNLYLHSALVQSRNVRRSREAVTEACRFNLIDSAVAMNAAFFVNAAILIVAAATFHANGHTVAEIQEAHTLLEGTLGSSIAPIAFALALLCAGQSSTVTGTLAGQITMEGFLQFRIKPWLRRLVTRSLAIIPAVLVIIYRGEKDVYNLLIFSQVILSVQLSFAVIPLIRFTCSKRKMGPFVTPLWAQGLAWLTAGIIMSLNGKLVYEAIIDALAFAGEYRWIVAVTCIPISFGLISLLAWMTLRPEEKPNAEEEISAEDVVARAIGMQRRFKRIGVALEAKSSDSKMLAEAVALAKTHRADLVLMHIVDGVGGTWYGAQTGDAESRDDEAYIEALQTRLRADLDENEIKSVEGVLGYGDASTELVKISKERKLDAVVMGGHGHRGIMDLLYGQTIDGVRHRLKIPVIAVRQGDG